MVLLFRVLHELECVFPTFVRVLKCSVDVDVVAAANNSNVVLGIVVSVQLEDPIADDDDVDVVMVVGYP